MDKCSPVEMRKTLELVDVFRKTGIRFVPMPVFDDEDRAKTVSKMQEKLSECVNLIWTVNLKIKYISLSLARALENSLHYRHPPRCLER
jgi:hypothetical protein